MSKKTITTFVSLGLLIGIFLTFIIGSTPTNALAFGSDIKTHLMVYSNYANTRVPVWGEGETWKTNERVKIIGITVRVSIMPLWNASDNTSYLTSGFSHGWGEVSMSDKPHDEDGVLLQGQVYFCVGEGMGAVADTSNANVATAYSGGNGVMLNAGQPLYIRMFHEVYSSDPKNTICDAVAVISYVRME